MGSIQKDKQRKKTRGGILERGEAPGKESIVRKLDKAQEGVNGRKQYTLRTERGTWKEL